MALILLTPATAPLISVAEAKAQCRVLHDDDDDYFAALVDAVSDNIDGAEGWLGRTVRPATWKYTLPCFPNGAVELPRPPLTSVTGIEYIDEDGATQAYTEHRVFNALSTVQAGLLLPAYDDDWPDTRDDTPDSVRVTFVAGYAATPEPIKWATRLIVAHLYENREDASEVSMESIPTGSASLLAPFRRWY